MIQTILFALWFFLPAGLANTAPIFAAHLPFLQALSSPLDGGKRFRNKRIFGDHKTIRGMLSGILVGILIVSLQIIFYKNSVFIRSFIPIDYTVINPLLFGTLAGFGALIGDAIKSFFKRQCGIASGKPWFPFDQLDYIFGGLICMSFVIRLSIQEYAVIIFIWFFMHLIASYIGYLLRLKKSPI